VNADGGWISPVEPAEVAIAVICCGRRVLVTRRGAGTRYAGMDEFPGGHRQPGESLRRCLERETEEETGLRTDVRRLLAVTRQLHSGTSLWLWFFACRIPAGVPPEVRGTAEAPRWLEVSGLDPDGFPPANRRVIELLEGFPPSDR
jgi:8-oxo-dGTP diphosphatase